MVLVDEKNIPDPTSKSRELHQDSGTNTSSEASEASDIKASGVKASAVKASGVKASGGEASVVKASGGEASGVGLQAP